MANTYKTLHYETLDSGALILFLNRPDAANTLNVEMALDIAKFFNDIASDAVRVVILTGKGNHFCAGADLKERKAITVEEWQRQHHIFEKAHRAVLHCSFPVIAAIEGAAFGGGLELALACDFIYASETARFALTEAKLGIMPGLGGTQALPRAVGMRRAKELMFRATPFTAHEAMEYGMVNRVCAPASLLEEAISCASAISRNAPLSVCAIKHAAEKGAGVPLADALECELSQYNLLLPTRDRSEGINAFNEKRLAQFNGE